MRRIVQRADGLLVTNWTLYDLRHTAASRTADGEQLAPVEVQAIMRHADIQTARRCMAARGVVTSLDHSGELGVGSLLAVLLGGVIRCFACVAIGGSVLW
ncbi:hypothetical protein AB0E83_12440 [Streptomyces sp. NPDC035033]|uniref:hypothetical protein n=1 Tax=Streptomyces sp. NPDC035033 TaxID=3155368 RepID=UPI0033CD84AA